jgi:hypothetical protein
MFWYSACNADSERYQKGRPSVHFEERASMQVCDCKAAARRLSFLFTSIDLTRAGAAFISRVRARHSNGN